MQTLFHDLSMAQCSLDDALAQLRDQQELVSLAKNARSHAALVVLLSNGLRQFYRIEEHRNGVLEALGEFLPMPRHPRINEPRRCETPGPYCQRPQLGR
jgi:hypothetical protein